ncbi:MAG: quinol dehydrogenase ferredoxin subunit NapH, partial [Candidatus Dactylopiibacterium sp.]|nr:quinol dehydrogenase ferredoxin subunit NapH [Candidatus Dactylopiibacterium sp.]
APRRALASWRWLLARRLTQALVLAAFLSGPWWGVWILKGNLAASRLFDFLPLTDPFAFLQTLASGHRPAADALLGVALVTGFYALIGGRVFCAWVCPMNVVTDSAAWLRRRLGLRGGHAPHAATRYWLAGALLVATAITGMQVWEWLNPVSMLQRGLIFGAGLGWLLVAGVFLYDLLLAGRGWCGRLCPMGAIYAWTGRRGLVHVSAARREACNDCMDCFAVCPEPQVIRPALKPRAGEAGHPYILDGACTRCARCLDVCDQKVFRLTGRSRRSEK